VGAWGRAHLNKGEKNSLWDSDDLDQTTKWC
jgi:hypothetical protein